MVYHFTSVCYDCCHSLLDEVASCVALPAATLHAMHFASLHYSFMQIGVKDSVYVGRAAGELKNRVFQVTAA